MIVLQNNALLTSRINTSYNVKGRTADLSKRRQCRKHQQKHKCQQLAPPAAIKHSSSSNQVLQQQQQYRVCGAGE